MALPSEAWLIVAPVLDVKHRIRYVISFNELVAAGILSGAQLYGGMPWHFKYNGHPITHENDDRYIIPLGPSTKPYSGIDYFNRGDGLATMADGSLLVLKGQSPKLAM